ncbi:MAG: PspC domain-containing protein [Ignavibacteria bacterium]|nr:PspC domain-containing protein [Ignavibacteria bacterium]
MQRAYRSKQNKVVGGVCAGLAEYFDIDPVLLRIGFAVAFFVYGTGFLLYIILMIALPNKEDLPGYIPESDTPLADKPSYQPRDKSKRNLMGGILLIVFGLIFLAENFIPNVNFEDLWPLLLVAFGATIIWNSFQRSSRPTPTPTINSQPPTFTQTGE